MDDRYFKKSFKGRVNKAWSIWINCPEYPRTSYVTITNIEWKIQAIRLHTDRLLRLGDSERFLHSPLLSYCWGSSLGEKWLILALSLNEVSVAFVLFCLESYLKILSILPPLSFMSQWIDRAQTHKCHHHCLMSRLFMLH